MPTTRFETVHQSEQSRYVLLDRGEDGTGTEEVGEERYLDVDGTEQPDRPERIFFHTVVSPAYTGQSLASIHVKFAVEDAIAQGHAVAPVCPYVAAWLPKHPEYDAHVVAPTPAHIARLEQHG